jgi:hypothetical protein
MTDDSSSALGIIVLCMYILHNSSRFLLLVFARPSTSSFVFNVIIFFRATKYHRMVFASPGLHKVRLVWTSGQFGQCVIFGLHTASPTAQAQYCRMDPETAAARGLCV